MIKNIEKLKLLLKVKPLTDENFWPAPWHEMVINNLPCLVGKKILEIATDEGALSRYLTGKGAEIFTADFFYIAFSEAQKSSSDTFT